MLVYRVFPYAAQARPHEPGHPLYVHPDQGFGRWDNPAAYRTVYVAASPTAAVGETFAHVSHWTRKMLPYPAIHGAVRALGTYRLNEETHPLLDMDDARTLLDRALRPTQVVIRDRPRTQRIALDAFHEGRWGGLSWWSMHRPQWTLYALWNAPIVLQAVDQLPAHPAVPDAADLLGKSLDGDLR